MPGTFSQAWQPNTCTLYFDKDNYWKCWEIYSERFFTVRNYWHFSAGFLVNKMCNPQFNFAKWLEEECGLCPGKCKKLLSANPVEKLLQKWTTSQGIIAQGTRDPGLQNFKSRVPQYNQQLLFNIQLITTNDTTSPIFRRKTHLVVDCCTHNCSTHVPHIAKLTFSSHFSSMVEFEYSTNLGQISIQFNFN